MGTPLHVLIVKESTDATSLLLQTLREGGFDPVWECVGAAPDLVATLHHQAWDVVIADNTLPQFPVLDVLGVLQENGFNLPCIIVSEQMDEEGAVAALKAGAHDALLQGHLARLCPVVERALREADDHRARQLLKQELRKGVERFRSLLENASDLITVLTPEGVVRYASPASERILGYAPEALIGLSLLTYVHTNDEASMRAILTQALHSVGVPHTVELRVQHRNGSWRLLEAVMTGSLADMQEMGIIMNARDISAHAAQTAALQYHSQHDALTDLPNRTSFREVLQKTISGTPRRNKSVALLLLDLDRFHEINNTFGHQWGDTVLQQIAPRLRSVLRKSDMLARIGGDEFAILLPAAGDIQDITQVAQRILHTLEQPFVIEGYTFDIAAQIGIVLYPEHGNDTEMLIRRAAIAAGTAKRTNSGYALYTADHDHYSPDRLKLMSELRHAIAHDQMVLYYQPQVSLATGHIARVEALVRWQHPQHGLMGPDRFIPLAEQTGLISRLSRWVLNAALRQCHTWRQQGVDLQVAVNLSMRDLQDAQLPDTISTFLNLWKAASTWLEVEITESALSADPERTLDILTRLSDMGVRIAIDDFGTGYASLSYLKQVPADEIKIDKSFVLGVTRDDNDAAIVRSTIDLGHTLNLTVVAEGVEDQATWDLLATLECDVAQGYFIGRPLPALDFCQWLKESPWVTQHRPAISLATASRAYGRRGAMVE